MNNIIRIISNKSIDKEYTNNYDAIIFSFDEYNGANIIKNNHINNIYNLGLAIKNFNNTKLGSVRTVAYINDKCSIIWNKYKREASLIEVAIELDKIINNCITNHYSNILLYLERKYIKDLVLLLNYYSNKYDLKLDLILVHDS